MPAPLFALLAGLLAVVAAACEKPDASHVTSPAASAAFGTTTGNVSYLPEGETAPEPVTGPEGWDIRLENARFSELENGTPSIQVVLSIDSEPGPGFELWLTGPEGTALRWSGGSARDYNGVVCFQLQLEAEGEALPLTDGPYDMTIAFREPGEATPVAADSERVAGFPPDVDGDPPGDQSEVARTLLGCPRSVI